jgi:hypothetical protein
MSEPVIGKKYNWVNQSERLVYTGKKGCWHQFAEVGYPAEIVWCEVLDSDLDMIEETKTIQQPEPETQP